MSIGADRGLGDEVVAYLVDHAERLSVDYIIWRQAIWNAADPRAGWRPMPDRGSPMANHYDHPHINLRLTPSAGIGVLDCLPASATVPAGPGARRRVGRAGRRPHHQRVWAPLGARPPPGADGACHRHRPRRGALTSYNHMYAGWVGVRVGPRVAAGQVIAAVGNDGNSSGCHLHFGVYLNDRHTDPESFSACRGLPLG